MTPFALPHVGGVETHVDEISRRVAAAGSTVTVLTADAGSGQSVLDERNGVTVRRFRSWPGNGDLHLSPGLFGGLRDCGADIIHVQGAHTLVAPLALLAAQRAGTPAIVTFHTGGSSSPVRRALRPLQWRALAPLLRRAAALVAVSEFEAELFSSLLGIDRSRVRLIRNGADPLPLGDASSGGTRWSGDPLVVSVGRLVRYKGQHRLIRAMPALVSLAPGARLVLAGSGPYERRLRRLADDLGVSGVVEFAAFGPDDREELGRLVGASDVVALLSDYEAHPVSLMEALALGRPIVVAATSGLVEMARNGLVRAIPPGTRPETVAQELLRAARGPRPRPVAIRSWDDCASELMDLYREIAR